MRKCLCALCVLLSSLCLTACAGSFSGSRIGNENRLIMEYDMFDTTDSQELDLKAGDMIEADIVVKKGTLAIKIQKGKEEPIYESDGIVFSNQFSVGVEEDGIYTVTVTGEKSKGSVSFVKSKD